ncbi:tetratricopeptide repeat protein [bacterium]|nr:tetratricopeptide repeat protein [bacterium]
MPNKTLAALLLLAVGTAIYANSLAGQFVWDDEPLVVANPLIRNATYLPEVFTTDLARENEASATYYRPLQTVTYLVDYALWGLNPFGYHLTNLLLHLGCVLLVWQLFEQLGVDRWWALGGALLFAVHPVNANAVAYVAGRADTLVLGALLAALLLWIEYDRHRAEHPLARHAWFTGSIIGFTLALFSRENALLFPVLVGLYAWLFGREETAPWRRALRAALPFVLLAGAFWAWRHAVVDLQSREMVAGWPLTTSVRLQVMLRAWATYASLLLWPEHLQMDRQLIQGGPELHWLALGGVGVGLGFLAWAWWAQRHDRLVLFGLGWLGLAILPVSGLLSLTASVAEHWLYLPAVGLYLASGRHLSRLRLHPGVTITAVGIGLAVLGARTVYRNADWRDGAHLFAQTAAAAPYSARARNNLGYVLRTTGHLGEAQRVLEEAERLYPRDLTLKANLAVLYQQQGKWDDALSKNGECLELDPQNVGTILRLADLYDEQGRYARARHHYLAALAVTSALRPRGLMVDFLLSHDQGHEALRVAQDSCHLEPGNAEGFLMLGRVLQQQGRMNEARHALERAQHLDRHHPLPPVQLGRLAAQEGDLAAATRHYRRAVRLTPGDPLLQYALGDALARQGNWTEAEQWFRAALRLAPESRRLQEAVADAERSRTGANPVP